MKVLLRLLAGAVLAAMLIVPGSALAQAEDWLVDLNLTTAPHIGTVPGEGVTFAFGARNGATEAYDGSEGDRIAPPDPQTGINAYFYYPENPQFQRNLVTSVVGPAATITWPLLVKSVGGPGDTQATLTWDAGDVGSVPGKYAVLELRDTAGNTLADMRSQSSYTFSLQSDETRNFHVVTVAVTHTIVASADAGGSISPSGEVSVAHGDDRTFTISPDAGYRIAGVLVDDGPVGAVETYTFENVTADHTIHATFEKEIITHTIVASAGEGGSISPAGEVSVAHGDDRTFTISPDAGYEIAGVLVDDEWVGAVATYTFENVTADHTIHATFEEIVSYSLTMAVAPAGTGTATDRTGEGAYEEGAAVEIKAAAGDGGQFFMWTASAGGFEDAFAEETLFTMPGEDVTVTAYFVAASKTETVTDGVLDARAIADTGVLVSGTATVTVALFDGNPGGPGPTGFNALGKYIDVYVPDVGDVDEIEIRLYYTADELAAAEVEEEALRLFWWDNTEWVECSDGGVNTAGTSGYSGYMWAKIRTDTSPSLAQLTGTPFGGYGAPPSSAPPPPPPSPSPSPSPGPEPDPTPPVEYNLSIDSTHGGSVTGPGEGTFTYDDGTAVALTAEPEEGYWFVRWSGDVFSIANTGAAQTSIVVDGDYSITATFGPIPGPYDLTVSSTAGGAIIAPRESTVTYEAGTVVALLAEPEEGYRFVRWTGDVDTIADVDGAETTITINGDYSITAEFAAVRVFPGLATIGKIAGLLAVVGLVFFLVPRRVTGRRKKR